MLQMPKAEVAGPLAYGIVDELLALLIAKGIITPDDRKALFADIIRHRERAHGTANSNAVDCARNTILPEL